MKNIRVHLLLSGTAQGGGYSTWVESKARQRGLYGWVRSLPDGKVELLLEGNERNARMMVEDARRGPTFSGVKEVRSEFHQYIGEFREFCARP